MTREEATRILVEAKQEKGISYEALGKAIGRDKVWTAAAVLGQASMDKAEAQKVVQLTGVKGTAAKQVVAALQRCPMKGAVGKAVPVDPLIYRFHEITQIYGPAIKEIIHEMFGDGIMSAIDFTMGIEKVVDPKGDRVKVTFNGKFLSYKKW